MIERTGGTFGRMRDHDGRNGTLTGVTFRADDQLQHIDTANIGNKTRR